jgi:uncharacterized protein YceK
VITIRQAVLGDCVELAMTMRQADVDEVRASHGHGPMRALLRSLEVSNEAWTAETEDGRIVAMFGVAVVNVLTGCGSVWALTSDAVGAHPKEFYKGSRGVVKQLLTRYSVLTNAISTKNVRALRWAHRIGFKIGEAEPIGIAGQLFHRIQIGG